ncbi:hypothetical protein DFH08DRAFT_807086 [Mycena albidolilacea]|uniref:Uncharacterized protein n=1 Tax=Mycena albidolilacea TaxID=1033008 RepID=A0AAD7ESK1_9AGAR|nr:hypothetical protein DFH08DRAFT_807086 [Mycena albidolilacea]
MTASSHPKYMHQLGKYSFQSVGEWTFGIQRDGAEGGKEGAEEKGEPGVEMRSAPEEGTDVEGGKARCRAHLESTTRKAKVQVRACSSASHTSAYIRTPSSSSISGCSKRLHGKKETRAEREEGSKTGRRTKKEGASEGAKEWNKDGWGSCNRRSRIEEGSRSQKAAVICTPSCCMQRGQSWVRAIGQQSLGLASAPFSEISRAGQDGYLDGKGGRSRTRAGWEGFCAPGGLRDDAQSAYSARRASWEQIQAHRVRQHARKRMRAGVDRLARLHGGLEKSGQTV